MAGLEGRPEGVEEPGPRFGRLRAVRSEKMAKNLQKTLFFVLVCSVWGSPNGRALCSTIAGEPRESWNQTKI